MDDPLAVQPVANTGGAANTTNPVLVSATCEPCVVGRPPLAPAEAVRLHAALDQAWRIVGDHHLERGYAFRNFTDAMAFANRVGVLADRLGHHPDIHVSWGKVRLTLWTHKSDGLTGSDFSLAAAIDRLG